MKEDIVNLKNEFVSQIISANSVRELTELEISYLGRTGKLTTLIKEIKNLTPEEKKEIGLLINDTKNTLFSLIAEHKNKLSDTKNVWFDPTIPGIKPKTGT